MDGGPAPLAVWLSRLCQEFGCLPSAALREWRRAPAGLIEEILEARAYIGTREAYDRAPKKSELPPSPMLDLVHEIRGRLVREELERVKREEGIGD
jgi:hypothetical protein